MDDVERKLPTDYPDFNAFFTRGLRAGARPVAPEPHTVVSPADGIIAEMGAIERGSVLRAKGRPYSLPALLGGDPVRAAPFLESRYVTVYLAPKNYHRVHMPVAGRLREMTYIPGRLFTVNPTTAQRIENVFARNERVVCVFDTDYGCLAMVMVGALFVGSVEHVWSGTVMPPRRREIRTWRYDGDGAGAVRLQRGQEMGRFNMGSTVIAVFAGGGLTWDDDIEVGASTRCGARLGRFVGAPQPTPNAEPHRVISPPG